VAIVPEAFAVSTQTVAGDFTGGSLAAHATDDLLVVKVAASRNVVSTDTITTATSGWTAVEATISIDNGSHDFIYRTFYKKATSASETVPVFEKDGSTTCTWNMYAYTISGAADPAAIVQNETFRTSPADNDPVMPAATVNENGSLIIISTYLSTDRLGNADTPPSGFTLRNESQPNGDLAVAVADDILDSFSASEWTNRWTGNLSALTELSVTLSVEPAAAGGTINEVTKTDVLAVTDDSIERRLRDRENLDNISIIDSNIKSRERNRLLSDSLAITDSHIYFKEARRVLTDSISVTDFIEILRERIRIQLDSIAIIDTSLKLRERNRIFSDAIAATDNVVASVGKVIAVTITDVIAVVDFAIELRERYRAPLDNITVTDSTVILRERNRILSDVLAITDNVIATYIPESGGVINDVTLTDTIALTDLSIQLRERNRTLNDTLSLIDTVNAERLRNRIISDFSVDVVDSLVRHRARIKTLIDSISVTDAANIFRTRGILLTDVIAVTDLLIQLRERYREISDDIIIIDNVIARYVTEILNPLITSGIELRDIDIDIIKEPIIDNIESLNIDLDIKKEAG
jgi:hypothetical protein